jgi:hypothetical protein
MAHHCDLLNYSTCIKVQNKIYILLYIVSTHRNKTAKQKEIYYNFKSQDQLVINNNI